ncbi:D-alanyl-D-alanine carboxypeptidase-like protein [Motilibacter peucedani]|uniref:D-alanyl-D-alanine carboxypeptidase-like protein n=1 Tax=Motilibacter peucedani TaxID=598650 RepID=A0A420XUC2_9ACTN|nr:M15 family metallopeptidase [Motilibacter peucedani]RKS80428.1 D-alanyl-D-alanine carboxypeptidase-like protein [Motilibacter peucedani]
MHLRLLCAGLAAATTTAAFTLHHSAPADPTAGLTKEMSARVDDAMAAARAAGVPLHITSGWRSAAHQQRLLDEAIAKYGSERAATQWVLPPSESEHVAGRAVDVGPAAGYRWLQQHGEAYGLCRRYANEPWHFEPLVRRGGTCPPLESHPAA